MIEAHSIDMDRRTGVALWRQIADRFRASLNDDIVGDNGKLPSEKDLAHHFGANRHTVRAASRLCHKKVCYAHDKGKVPLLLMSLIRRKTITENRRLWAIRLIVLMEAQLNWSPQHVKYYQQRLQKNFLLQKAAVLFALIQ